VIEFNGKKEVLWPDHCVQGTYGQNFHPDLNLNIEELYIFKKGENPNHHPYSVFGEILTEDTTSLADFLKARNIKANFVCGLTTDYCVKDTALDSVKEGFNTFVILDACRGIAEDLTENNFELMNNGITLLDTTELA
jgi:nicotinamidase/pyrazinamidase